MDTPFLDVLTRLGLAALLCGAVGLEREMRQKPAGLKTHTLVGVGAATFVLMALELAADAGTHGHDRLRLDPTRVVEGIVGGLGFLGAGSIIQSRGSIEGLTTAATIWLAGSVGAACGLAYYPLAGCAAALALVVVTAVRHLEHRVVHEAAERRRDGDD